ncbi:hypothetical protein DFA_02088 [Cavenderia fasciculata]|uniref:Uncharacterized protein n=1 Tax=Cavenderia fasciculata TaxID=261658 RepID=F4PYN5_CACFS|nr:uncharacterized protein DFA_02088 [Cavenderia fasciculata]EGG19301.1 hypothetical protein DFA_02088 [Cavenderia fasciculata]|eukprot:XP_004357572.1 hypothetical protein DFA_02088 [Cavenderia fasciculata]
MNKEIKEETITTTNNNNNDDKCYFIFGGDYLPNRIIYLIVQEISNDTDLICLLLTCKQFFYNFKRHYNNNFGFKGIELVYQQENQISSSENIQYRTLKVSKSLYLQSFADIFHNTFSHQIVKGNNQCYNYPATFGLDGHEEKVITKALIQIDPNPTIVEPPLLVNGLPDTVKWLAINGTNNALTVEGGYRLPICLERLEFKGKSGVIGKGVLPESLVELCLVAPPIGLAEGVVPESVRSITISNARHNMAMDPLTYNWPSHLTSLTIINDAVAVIPRGFLPSTLTSLEITLTALVPGMVFPRSLVNLKLSVCTQASHGPLDLSLNTDLTTLELSAPQSFPKNIKIGNTVRLPSTLTHLGLHTILPIPSLSTFIPQGLRYLSTHWDNIKDSSDQLPTTLTQLKLIRVTSPIPIGLLAPCTPSIQSVELGFWGTDTDHNLMVGSIPESVHTLSLFNYRGTNTQECIPHSVKHLIWASTTTTELVVFPPTIQTLQSSSTFATSIQIPPFAKSISFSCKSDSQHIFHIDSLHLHESNVNRFSNIGGQILLVPETVKSIHLRMPSVVGVNSHFRFDQIIYQTNADEFSIDAIWHPIIHCYIRRFENSVDNDYFDVLIVDKVSLHGGFIRLPKQQKPLYLNWKVLFNSVDPPTISRTILEDE